MTIFQLRFYKRNNNKNKCSFAMLNDYLTILYDLTAYSYSDKCLIRMNIFVNIKS